MCKELSPPTQLLLDVVLILHITHVESHPPELVDFVSRKAY